MGCKVSYVPLGELAEFESGGTPSKKIESYWGGSIPWISAKTLVGDTVYESDLTISKEGLESGSKLASKGSLLLLTRGSGLFKRIPLAIAGIQVAYNQDIKCISANAKGISNRYLFYALKALEPAISAMLETTGIGAGKLATDRLKALPIPVLAEDARAKVTSFADCIYGKISLNAKLNGYLLELAMARFESALETESKAVRLGDVVALEDSKRIPLNSRDREARKGPYPYYGATSVMDHVDDYLFDGVRVLLGEDGTVIDSEGKPILQYVWGKYWVNNHAHILAPSAGYSLEAIYIALSRTAINHIVTGAVQMKISQRNLKSLEIEMPSPESLDYLQDLFAVYRSNQDESAKLASLRDVLLPKLMSGEIDVSKVDLTQLNSHLLEIDVTLEVLDRCIEIAVRTVVCVHVWMVSQEMRNTLIEVSYELS